MRSKRSAVVVVLVALAGAATALVPTTAAAAATPTAPRALEGVSRLATGGARAHVRARRATRTRTLRHARRSAVGRRVLRTGATPCADGSGALCGFVTVPVDWRFRTGRSLRIAYKLYLHTGPGAAVSAIVPNFGGPGQNTMFDGDAGFVDFLFGPLRDRFDVLLIDDRGRGASGAIDCPALQHALGSIEAAVKECAAVLGPDIDKYGTASIARDTEAVRRTVGARKLDYFGVSYGTMDAVAYAVRFPDRVRSIVMGSGYAGAPYPEAISDVLASVRRTVTGLCRPGTACHAAIPDPLGQLAWGEQRLAAAPVEGDGSDASGAPVHVVVDAKRLADVIQANDSSALLNQGELPAALVALRSGDTAPLIRIAAETPVAGGLFGDAGDPTGFSLAAFFATDCADYLPPWRRGLSRAGRLVDTLRVTRQIDPAALAPFHALTVFDTVELDNVACSYWPDTTAEAPIPAGARYPDVPVIAFVGDFDQNSPAEFTTAIAHRFRRHQIVDVGRVPHAANFWRCAPEQAQAFIASPGRVSTACEAPQLRWWAQAAFPRTSAGIPPLGVDASGADASTPADRRLAAAVAATVLDARLELDRVGLIAHPALRGGLVTDVETDTGLQIDLDGARFVDDVAVTGRLDLGFDGNDATGTFTFSGPGGATGTISVAGQVGLTDRDGSPLTVTGTVDGRPVSLLAPTI